jgi:hypothetical protein
MGINPRRKEGRSVCMFRIWLQLSYRLGFTIRFWKWDIQRKRATDAFFMNGVWFPFQFID